MVMDGFILLLQIDRASDITKYYTIGRLFSAKAK